MRLSEKFPDKSWVRLIEQPSGYTTSDYDVSVGQIFRVCTRMGCCLEVENGAGERFIINADSFKQAKEPVPVCELT